MNFKNVAIAAIEHILPPIVITSEAIETRLHTLYGRLHLPQGRLELMTGIRERRAWPEPILPSAASTLAGQAVLKKVNIVPDLLIHASVCRDRLEPATAAYVHQALHLPPETLFFDLSNACLGFLNALMMVAGLIETQKIRSALIVCGENGKPLLDRTLAQLEHNTTISRQEVKAFFANLTIGSGAVAALITHDTLLSQPTLHIQAITGSSNSAGCTLCQGDSDDEGLVMQTDSGKLLELGIQLAKDNWQKFLSEHRYKKNTFQHTICHQVGLRHRAALYEALELDLRTDYSTFPFLGNTGSVALPITLSLALESGRINPGDHLALLGIGSGISSLMVAAQYRE